MGLLSNIAGRISRAFSGDKDHVIIRAAQGATAPIAPTGFNLLQAYGYDVLADYLRLDSSLLERYADYEEMDDFPEISCLSGFSRIQVPGPPGTAPSILELVAQQEKGERSDDLLVYAFDHSAGRVVVAPAKGPRKTGTQAPVYKVTFEEYRPKGPAIWSIRCTAQHLFMLRDGTYQEASKLVPGQRLMPCTVTAHASTGYLVVYEPLQRTSGSKAVYTNVHRLVMQAQLGRALTDSEVIHHKDRNKSNASPSNLEVTTHGAHARLHVHDPVDEAKRVAAISESLRTKWSDPEFKKRTAENQRMANPTWLKREQAGEHKRYQAKGTLSPEHRAAIAKGRTIPLARDVVEAQLRASASVNDAAKALGVSWNTLSRRMAAYELSASVVGSNLGGPKPGERGYRNHRVVSVEFAGLEDVYDIEVPHYHNFAVGDPTGEGFVFVHNSALDIFADDATQPDTITNRTVWATSKNVRVRTEIDALLKRLNMDEEIWEIARSLVKYGNDTEELLVNDDGVIGLNYLPPPSMRRIEGRHGELYGFIQDPRGKIGFSVDDFKAAMAKRQALITGDIKAGEAGTDPTVAFEDWEVVHFRLRGKQRRSVYGHSILDAARWIWRRLMLLEDAAMIYRLHRAPERFAFYVNVGDRSDQEAMLYLNRMRQQFRKNKYVNPRTGYLDQKVNPPAQDEDFYIPFRTGEDGSRVELLSAPSWQCLVGETPVPLVDGTTPTIQELAARGGDFWVYAIDAAGHVVPGRGRAARQTHANAEIWEVTLDNNEVVRCTGNHPFLSRDGKWILAEHLRPGDSLMPLYRKVSTHGAGDRIAGYEKVYDPADDTWVYTHHRVFEQTTNTPLTSFFAAGHVIHHANFDKRNNSPSNLRGMLRSVHTAVHQAAAVGSWSKPERRARHRAMMVQRMSDVVLRADKARVLAEWNRSQDHKDRITGTKNPKWQNLDIAGLQYLVVATGARNIKELMVKGRVSQSVIARVLKTQGLTWNDFAQQSIPNWMPKGRARCITNHAVKSVRNTGIRSPVYDLTVEGHANFAIGQGVFVSNSMDDVEYFRGKLFTAIKIPRAYMGDDDGAVRSVLSSQDIRFARTVLRVQRELRNGMRKIARVHLAALNIDPNSVDFDIQMTVPSALLEMAQVEARAARADLAGRMRDFVSLHWVLSHVFNMDDEEIQKVFMQRDEDVVREGKAQGAAQGAAQPPMDMGGGFGGEEQGMEGGAPPEGEGEEAPPEGEASAVPEAPPTAGPFERRGPHSRSHAIFSARRIGWELPSGRRMRGGGRALTEQELFAGHDREAQRRAEGKLEALLKNDRALSARLQELRELMSDLRASVTSKVR